MAIRPTEVVVLAKVQVQGQNMVRKLAQDFRNLGSVARMAEQTDATRERLAKQNLRVSNAGAAIRQAASARELAAQQHLTNLADNRYRQDRARYFMEQGSDRSKALAAQQLNVLQQRAADIQKARTNAISKEQYERIRLAKQAQFELTQQKLITKELEKQEASLARAVKARKFATPGRIMSHGGRAATFLGGISTIGFASASAGYAEFNRLATRAATQTGNSVETIVGYSKDLENQILRMMKLYPASAQEMSEAAYDIYSSINVNYTDGIKLLEMFNKAAVAGGIDVVTATDAIITVFENFDSELSENGKMTKRTTEILDQLFSIVRYGRMSFADTLQIFGQVAPAAHAAGSDIEDVAGAVALLTRRLGVAKAGASLARFFEMVGNKDFQKGMEKAGLTITKAGGGLKPLPKIIEQLHNLGATEYNDLPRVISQFGKGKGVGREFTVQGRRGLTVLLQGYGEYVYLQKQAAEASGEFEQSYKAMSESAGVRWQVAVNQLKVFALEIGRAAIPAIISLFNWVGALADKWRSLDPAIRDGIVRVAAFTSVIMLLGGPIVAVAGMFTQLAGVLYALKPAAGIGGAAGGARVLTIGLTRLGGVASAVTIALTGLYAAYKEFTQNDVKGNLSQKVDRGFFTALKRIEGDVLKYTPMMPVAKLHDKIYDALLGQEWLTGKSTPKKKGKDSKTKGAFDEFLDNMNLAQVKIDTQMEAWTKKHGKTYDDLLKETENFGNAEVKKLDTWRKNRAKVIRQAAEDANTLLTRAADALVQKYNEIRSSNQSAFGTLFQGPWLTSETVNLAKEWGVTPGMQDLTRDLREQRTHFQKWNSTLASISKRGAPRELVDQLRELGPEALDYLSTLTRSTPTEFKKFVGEWKKGQAAITSATEANFKTAMERYKIYGGDVVNAIVDGIDANDKRLHDRFEKLIKDSFGADTIRRAISKAVTEWEQDNPQPTANGSKRTGKAGTLTDYPSVNERTGNPMLTGARVISDIMAPPFATSGKTVVNNYNLYTMPQEDNETFIRRVAWNLKRNG